MSEYHRTHRASVDDDQLELLADETRDTEMGEMVSRWKLDDETRVIGLAGVREARKSLQSDSSPTVDPRPAFQPSKRWRSSQWRTRLRDAS